MSEEAAAAKPAPRRALLDALPGTPLRVGIVATLVLLLLGFVSLIWTPWPLADGELFGQLLGPSLSHPLGTDALGRDGLSLLMRGVLTSYVVGAIAVAIGLFLGVPLGLAATTGGTADWIVSRLTGFVTTVPTLAVAAVLATLAGPGPINAMAAIGLALVPVFARVTRDGMRVLMRTGHVDAARLSGMGRREAAARHVFPVLGPLLLSQALVQLGFAVIAETAFSYAGLGAQATGMSLGLMLREAQGNILFEPVLVIGPGLAVAAIAAMLQLAGDGLRRTLPPELRAEERDDAVA